MPISNIKASSLFIEKVTCTHRGQTLMTEDNSLFSFYIFLMSDIFGFSINITVTDTMLIILYSLGRKALRGTLGARARHFASIG